MAASSSCGLKRPSAVRLRFHSKCTEPGIAPRDITITTKLSNRSVYLALKELRESDPPRIVKLERGVYTVVDAPQPGEQVIGDHAVIVGN